MRILLLALFAAMLTLTAAAQQTQQNIQQQPEKEFEGRFILREPHAWSALKKYCLACHGADVIDKSDYSAAAWDERINKCYMYMASRGYVRPTPKDKAAIRDFLAEAAPKSQNPPVYLWPPKRGSIAVP